MNRKLFQRSDVTLDGRISKFGTIRILSRTAFDSSTQNDDKVGLECWHPTLYDFRGGRYLAQTSDSELVIKDGNNQIAVVDYDEIRSVNKSSWFLFGEKGWLFPERDKAFMKTVIGEILKVERGEKPMYLDNSDYIQISPESRISRAFVLVLHPYAVIVFNEDGEQIAHRTSGPLSYEKWDPKQEETLTRCYHGYRRRVRL